MAYFTTTQTFPPANNTIDSKTALLVVDAGTGSVSLEVLCGSNWIVQELFDADAAKRVYVGGGTWRCVVTGNATFDWTL